MAQALKVRRMQDLPLKGKRVLMRVDYNVPLDGSRVVDATRIKETVPTIQHLLQEGCPIVLIAHLGRPKGKPEPKYSLKPVVPVLEKLVGAKVRFGSDCVGPEAKKTVEGLKPGQIALLENLRFHAEEEKNDPSFSKALAENGEVFVQEAFGALHRAHASTAGVPKVLPGGIGFLVQKELEFLDRVVNNPTRPFLAVLGGAKVSDKIGVILRLLERVDSLVIGGGMAYTFLAAQGISIGKSLVEPDKTGAAKEIIEKAFNRDVECLLPADHVIVKELKADAPSEETQGMAVPEGWLGVDIGPRTIELFAEKVRAAKTIFWNGPMGVFEMAPFAKGSVSLAEAVGEATRDGATTIVGGGDTLAVLSAAGVTDVTHRSTGGGASLELLEGKQLPGLAALAAKT